MLVCYLTPELLMDNYETLNQIDALAEKPMGREPFLLPLCLRVSLKCLRNELAKTSASIYYVLPLH